MNNAPIESQANAIAVIGMAGRFPQAKDLTAYWRNLCTGVEAITHFSDADLQRRGVRPEMLNDPHYVKSGMPLDGIECFDAAFFGFTPREAQFMDPQQRFFLECAWEALEHAGYASDNYPGAVGVYAGASENSYLLFNLWSHPALIEAHGFLPTLFLNGRDFLATRISYALNLKGPSLNVQTACSTSLVAVHLACQGLLNGECDLALAGGVSINARQDTGYRYQPGSIASPDGHCRAFDAQAQGTTFGNGIGIVALKRLSQAIEDGDTVHAVILGSAINNDGAAKVGYTAPSLEGQVAVITEALGVAQVSPATLSYIEAHGTGTPLGDPIEVAALTQVFRDETSSRGFCALGSVKTNIGHLDAAAGVAGLIKTVLALKNRQIPPSLNFTQPNPSLALDQSPFYVNARLADWPAQETPRRAGVSAFGIGGTNAHVVLEEAPQTPSTGDGRPWQVVILSAKTAAALESATGNLCQHLAQNPELSLADAAYTLQVGRRTFNHRRVVVAQQAADAQQALETLDPERVFTRLQAGGELAVGFLFPGQGAQYPQMAKGLYQSEPVFQKWIDRGLERVRSLTGFDLRPVLFPSAANGEIAAQRLSQTEWAQPALFIVEYALARLWQSWGVQPQAMLGHSLGEYVAACLAGVFSWEDALKLVAVRGHLMQSAQPGAMLAVSLPLAEAEALVNEEIALAALNGPTSCVLAGPQESIAQVAQQLAGRGVTCRRLHTSHAFHSGMMHTLRQPFEEQVKQVTLKPPQRPYLSNLTGTWITAAEATDPQYWSRHLCQTVRFADNVQTLLQADHAWALLEVGPGHTLASLVRPQLGTPQKSFTLPSMRHPQETRPDEAVLAEAVGKLWLAGIDIHWPGYHAHEQRRRLPLPTYPFERQKFWIEPAAAAVSSPQPAVPPDAGGSAATAPTAGPADAPDLGLHPRPELMTTYQAPRTAIERQLAELWQTLLGIAPVGVQDNFFELGGTSLLATQFVLRIGNAFQVQLPLQVLFENPTVAGMAQAIQLTRQRGATGAIDSVLATDLSDEAVLEASIDATGLPPVEADREPAAAFLTGVTGFLGAFVLHELLRQTQAKIYCLVRASSSAEGLQRIEQNLHFYRLAAEAQRDRIIPVPGDLAQPHLGLPAETFETLARQLDVIYHVGAQVDFLSPYPQLKAANVQGTHEVLRLASHRRIKPVHFVSTLAVFAPEDVVEAGVIREKATPRHSAALIQGYARSKWVAEQLLARARGRGLPITLYRSGTIGSHTQTGACQIKDFLWRMIKACVQLESVPDIDESLDLAPVDYISQAIVRLSGSAASHGQNFHFSNPQPIRLSRLIEHIRALGYVLEPVPFARWRSVLLQSIERDPHHETATLGAFFGADVWDERMSFLSFARFDCQNTLDGLAGTGLTCAPITAQTVAALFQFFNHSGFLPADDRTHIARKEK
ncbi:MAG: type I polyketide synthase [Chloroflexota bacterium]